MIHTNGFQQALQTLNVPTSVLKSYYHNIIDTPHQEHCSCIQPTRQKVHPQYNEHHRN